jgi:hypothetical protein
VLTGGTGKYRAADPYPPPAAAEPDRGVLPGIRQITGSYAIN